MTDFEDEVDELTISFGDLDIGQMYPIKNAVKEIKMFSNKQRDCVKIDISNKSVLKKTTYIPSSMVKKCLTLIDKINAAGKTSSPYQVCYYGSIGQRFYGRLHAPGDGMCCISL